MAKKLINPYMYSMKLYGGLIIKNSNLHLAIILKSEIFLNTLHSNCLHLDGII